jgi:very-short-patch-repair endonuclease
MTFFPSRKREWIEGWAVPEFPSRPSRKARELRQAATPAERMHRTYLSRSQVADTKFSRQLPIGPFICDFVSRSARVVIEVDGGQHDENEGRDRDRTAYIGGMGFKLIRFWNNEVLENIEGFVSRIERLLSDWPPAAAPACGRG